MSLDPAPLRLPASLSWLRGNQPGRVWLSSLPGRLAAAVDRWTLRLGAPYEGGSCALVAPATLADGAPAVLKLPFPDRESEHEADALERWNGDGAVRLLGRDDGIGAMLIERCLPGTRLAEADPDRRLGVRERPGTARPPRNGPLAARVACDLIRWSCAVGERGSRWI